MTAEQLRERLGNWTKEIEGILGITDDAITELAARDREIDDLREEVKEYEFIFDLGTARSTEATAAWRGATGKHNASPDLGALLEWLLKDREELADWCNEATEERDEAIAKAEKLAEAVEDIADCMGPEALPAVNDLAMMAHVALNAYRNRPQVSQYVDTSIKQRTIRDTVLQEKDTHFACNWEYGPHREPMRPEWRSGCGKIHPKMLSEEWHDLCPYCGKPVSVPGAMEEI